MSKLTKYLKKQVGGNSVPKVIAEKGEYFKDVEGKVQKVSDKMPEHDDPYLVTSNGITQANKGEGGVLLDDVASVVSNTQETKNDSYNEIDESIGVKPKEAEYISKSLGLKVKTNKTISPSKFIDLLQKQVDKELQKYTKQTYTGNYKENSITANKAVVSKLPTLENIYDLVFQLQESKKQNVESPKKIATQIGGINPKNKGLFIKFAKSKNLTVQQAANKVLNNKEDYSTKRIQQANFAKNASKWNKKQQGGVIKGSLLKYPIMYGNRPTALAKTLNGKLMPVEILDGKTISMDNMFYPDSVEIKGNKAKTFYKAKNKQYIKKCGGLNKYLK